MGRLSMTGGGHERDQRDGRALDAGDSAPRGDADTAPAVPPPAEGGTNWATQWWGMAVIGVTLAFIVAVIVQLVVAG
jgi:hypothetical protein